MPFEIIGANLFLPLFSVRDPTSWGVRVSFLFPPPRTLLGALAHGTGIILGVASGEEKLKGEAVRNILTYAFEAHSFVTVRPLSPLVKSSQILRFVPPIEKGEQIGTPQEAHDAFKTDIVFSGDMKVIYLMDIVSINRILKNYDLSEIYLDKISHAARLIDRIGQTEAVCYTKKVEGLEIDKASPTVNTYLPCEWLEDVEGDYCVGELLPNLYILKSLGKIPDMNMSYVQNKDARRMKITYLFPLKLTKGLKGKEVFEATEVKIKLKQGYTAYLLKDGTRIALPSQKETETL